MEVLDIINNSLHKATNTSVDGLMTYQHIYNNANTMKQTTLYWFKKMTGHSVCTVFVLV